MCNVSLHTVSWRRFEPFQGILVNAVFGEFFKNDLWVNSVNSEDYAINKISVNIDTPVIVCL